MAGMTAPLRTCSVCSAEFELLPNKPGFANTCPACSGPKPLDPKAAREADRQRKRGVVQSALESEIRAKKQALANGKVYQAEECEKRILQLLKLKSSLG